MDDRHSKVLKQTIVLSLVLFFLLTTFLSFYYIVVFLMGKDSTQYESTGLMALASNNVFYLIGFSFSSNLGNFKRQLLIVALCFAASYAIYLPGFGKFWGLMVAIVGSLLSGTAMAVLWVVQGGYIAALFRHYQVEKEQEGKYIGLMNAIIYIPILVGALVTLTMTAFNKTVYLLILVALSLVAFTICYFFLDPLDQERQEQTQQANQVSTCVEEFKSMLSFYPQLRHILVAMFLDGIILGYSTTDLEFLIPQDIKTSLAMTLLLIFNGTGAAVGGLFSGFLSDFISVVWQGTIFLVIMILACIATLFTAQWTVESMFWPLIMSFIWGMVLYSIDGWIFVCCTKVYGGKVVGYAVSKQATSIAMVLFQIYQALLLEKGSITPTMIIIIVLGMLALISTIGYLKQSETAGDNENREQELQLIEKVD